MVYHFENFPKKIPPPNFFRPPSGEVQKSPYT